MERLFWSIGSEEYLSSKGIENRTIWFLCSKTSNQAKDKDGNEYKITKIENGKFILWIGNFYPHNKIVFKMTYNSLQCAKNMGELLYLYN